MPDIAIVASFAALFQALSGCFTRPSFVSFVIVACGWVLCLRRHTITQLVLAAGAVGFKDIGSFHRFFSRGRWMIDQFGVELARLMIGLLLGAEEPLVVPLDDTLGRHTGKKIAAASMHRDPLLSTGRKAVFHWGHLWVVLAINVRAFGKVWALPVLFRLFRSQKRCKAEGRRYRKTTELARELVELLAAAMPQRRIYLVVDGAYTNSTLLKKRPANVTVVGRGRLDAVLYAPPPPRRAGQMGRPRVKGVRLPSPKAQAAEPCACWEHVTVHVYGKTVALRVLVIDALWYTAASGQLLRLVVVRGFPGHERDDVFVSTDPAMPPSTIIERYAERWPIEVTFHEVKGKLGFEQPQNRNDHAVEHTAPLALWLYSLVVLWYIRTGQHLRALRWSAAPWNRRKTQPAFSDMLATLRRASWLERLSAPHASVAILRKRIRPILEYAAAVT